jgi:hypothetical protein
MWDLVVVAAGCLLALPVALWLGERQVRRRRGDER